MMVELFLVHLPVCAGLRVRAAVSELLPEGHKAKVGLLDKTPGSLSQRQIHSFGLWWERKKNKEFTHFGQNPRILLVCRSKDTEVKWGAFGNVEILTTPVQESEMMLLVSFPRKGSKFRRKLFMFSLV